MVSSAIQEDGGPVTILDIVPVLISCGSSILVPTVPNAGELLFVVHPSAISLEALGQRIDTKGIWGAHA